MENTVIGLKPCPFCGNKPRILFFNNDVTIRKYNVGCNATLCPVKPTTRLFATVDEAVDAWNIRAGDTE